MCAMCILFRYRCRIKKGIILHFFCNLFLWKVISRNFFSHFRWLCIYIYKNKYTTFLTFQASSSRYCDQICTNTNGSYLCDCYPGYELLHNQFHENNSDNQKIPPETERTCIALNEPKDENATLIFANSVDIKHTYLNGSPASKPIRTHETLALDFLHRNRSLCWISHNNHINTKEKTRENDDANSEMKCAKIDDLDHVWRKVSDISFFCLLWKNTRESQFHEKKILPRL